VTPVPSPAPLTGAGDLLATSLPFSALSLSTAMKEGLLGETLNVHREASPRRPVSMLHVGLDLSRRKADVCLLSGAGKIVDEWASPPDADGLRGLAARAPMWGGSVRGGVESMNGARFMHDRLEEHGWEGLIADATKVKGLAPLGLQDRQDRRTRPGQLVGARDPRSPRSTSTARHPQPSPTSRR
jgi:hypothetical protein